MKKLISHETWNMKHETQNIRNFSIIAHIDPRSRTSQNSVHYGAGTASYYE